MCLHALFLQAQSQIIKHVKLDAFLRPYGNNKMAVTYYFFLKSGPMKCWV